MAGNTAPMPEPPQSTEARTRVPLRTVAALFLRLGATSFGGPAAHIALMEDEVVRRRGWLTHAEFLDLLGATNHIPGPNSTEMAIHIGHRVAIHRARQISAANQTKDAAKRSDFAARSTKPNGVGPVHAARPTSSLMIQPRTCTYWHGKISVVTPNAASVGSTQRHCAPRRGTSGTSGAIQSGYCGEPTLVQRINPTHARSEPAIRCTASPFRLICPALAAR